MTNLLFDYFDRQIILDFYKNNPTGNWKNTPFVVTRYEITKAKKAIQKSLDKIFIPILDFMAKIINKLKK